MESKEALEELYSYSMLDDDIAKQNVEIIKKDLAMLEIIKKYERIFYVSTILPPYVILSGSIINDVEDAKKIKEWLEK